MSPTNQSKSKRKAQAVHQGEDSVTNEAIKDEKEGASSSPRRGHALPGTPFKYQFEVPEDVGDVVSIRGEGRLCLQDLLCDGGQDRLDGERGEVSVDHNTVLVWGTEENLFNPTKDCVRRYC